MIEIVSPDKCIGCDKCVQVCPTNVFDTGALAPGVTLTKFTERHLRRPDGTVDPARLDAFVSGMRALSPLGMVGEPIDQAWLILFLVSDASRTCTGQIWRANGGQTIPR